MPLPSAAVGSSTEPVVHHIDERWTMAYAASIGDLSSCYLDTRQPGSVVAHPVFPVCVEWPSVLDARHLVSDDVLPRHEAVRGIHATHDLRIDRLIRPGDVLTTRATVAGVERRRPGAYQVLELTTTDAAGAIVSTTRMGSLFLGVDVVGDDRPIDDPAELSAPADGAEPMHTLGRALDGGAAHVYTEGSHIWNPIHTDPAVAEAAGLPGIILHGTATLAMAVSAIVARVAGGDPTSVRRVRCRFGAMVPLPSSIEIRISERSLDPAGGLADGVSSVGFDVRNQAGERAIRDGLVVLGRTHDPVG